MVAPYPDTDRRGVKELRQDLQREVKALVPELSQPPSSGEFGNALYELALRMSGKMTSRLNRTAERDAIAFFDTFDIPAPTPRAAEAPLVFTLAEKRDDPVLAPAGLQVGAQADADEIIFETKAALQLTPARLSVLIAADLDADTIELAPANVTSPAPQPGPFPQYKLATFAAAGSLTVQVTPATGLQKGDLIRVGQNAEVHRIDNVEQDLCTVSPGLKASFDVGASVGKITQFDAFRMLDAQAHEVFIAHDELLNLKQPAVITLRVDPSGVARRLGSADISLFVWDTRKKNLVPPIQAQPSDGAATAESAMGGSVSSGRDTNSKEEEPKDTGWHELMRMGVSGTDLSFYKWWEGEPAKVKVDGQQHLWLKLALNTKMLNGKNLDTRVESVDLMIQSGNDGSPSAAPVSDPTQSGETQITPGSKTVERAFHNNSPLSTSTSFQPFGPEPQRFDTFAVSAPEALSKKRAVAILAIKMVDATLSAAAMTGVENGSPLRAYGIGQNGRLQAITFGDRARTQWMEIGHPQISPSTAQTGTVDKTLELAPRAPQSIQIADVEGNPRDLVTAWDRASRLWCRTAGRKEDNAARAWRAVPSIDQNDATKQLKDLVAVKADAGSAMGFAAFLIGLNREGLYVLGVASTGVLQAEWRLLTPTIQSTKPQLGGNVALVQVLGNTWPILARAVSMDLVLVDTSGAVLQGRLDLTNHTVEWSKLQARLPTQPLEDVTANPKIRPAAALRGNNDIMIAAADQDQKLFAVTGQWNRAGRAWNRFFIRRPPAGFELVVPEGAALACLPSFIDAGARWPAIAAVGWPDPAQEPMLAGPEPVLAIWTRLQRIQLQPLPADNLAVAHLPLLWTPRAAPDPPFIVLGGASEDLLWAGFDNTRQVDFELYNRFQLTPATAAPDFVSVDFQGSRSVIKLTTADALVRHARSSSYSVPTSMPFGPGAIYQFLNTRSGGANLSGTLGSTGRDLTLSDTHTTQAGDTLIIANASGSLDAYPVVSIDAHRVAALNRNVNSATTTITYTTTSIQQNAGSDSRVAAAEDIATLVNLTNAPEALRAGKLRINQSTGLLEQDVLDQSQDARWLLVKPWTTVPSERKALLIREMTFSNWSAEPLNRGYQNPELSWEYFDGRGWRRLGLLADETYNLARSGRIVFIVPDDLEQTDVAGQKNYWIRAQLIGGDYGHAQYVVNTIWTSATNQTQAVTVDATGLHAPEIFSIEVVFQLDKPVHPQLVLVDNNGGVLNQTEASAEPNATFDLFEGLRAIDSANAETDLAGRVLFLGFTKPFGVHQLMLYADADEQSGDETLQAEILTQRGWRDAITIDETHGLRRGGFIQVAISEEAVRAALFGQELYWARLRLNTAPPPAGAWEPRIRGLYINAVLADQAKTITQELLGSSDGSPHQTYQLVGKPVLLRGALSDNAASSDVEIRVRETLSDEDRISLTAENSAAVVTLPDTADDWVLWQRSDSLLGEDGAARVFKLDPQNGVVQFGDNRSGMIPPAGRDCIRAFRYRQGGGTVGNAPAYAIKNLKTSLESVDSVANPVAAAGGFDTPPMNLMLASASARLRHAGHALAPADLEALAVSSSPDVLRARLLRPHNPGGRMRLAIALRSPEPRPRLSRARGEALAHYLIENAAGSLTRDALEVSPPDYVEVKVTVNVLARSPDFAPGIDTEVRARVSTFLHPTNGGYDGNGWPFARRVWPSDIDRLLADIDGIDRLTLVDVQAGDRASDLNHMLPTAIICAAADGIAVQVDPGMAS